jgi:hypothetical protein
VRDYCQTQGLDVSNVEFHIEPSELVLPRLDLPTLDLILIDGSHAFPNVFIDYFYSTRALVVGGHLVLDDVHLWTGKVLRDFLNAEPEWKRREERDGRTVAYQKIAEAPNRDWFEQRYVNVRSMPWRARARMAESLLRRGEFGTLHRYAEGLWQRR